MEVKRIFKGRDYALGRWIMNLLIASGESYQVTESFELGKMGEITLQYDNKGIKKLIRRAKREMERGRILY